MHIPSVHLEHREFLPGKELNSTITKRETPQIGGSSAGFIALVVCLVMIIVVSCSAIFYLLKYNDPSDAERGARRQRRYAHQSVPSSSYTYDPSSTPSKGWFNKVTSIFNKRTSGSSTSSKGRKNGKRGDGLKVKLGSSNSSGWVQAGSGDEWDSGDDGVGGGNRTRDMATAGASPLFTPNPYSHTVDSPFVPPRESLSSTYLDSHSNHVSPSSYGPTSSSQAPPLPPGAHDPSSSVMIATIGDDVSPFPTSPISHQRTFSPEQMSAPADDIPHHHKNSDSLDAVDTRKWSIQSDVSARTSTTGTKFIEGL